MNSPARRAEKSNQYQEVPLVRQVREDRRYGISTQAKKECCCRIGKCWMAVHPAASFFPQSVHDYEKDRKQTRKAGNACFCQRLQIKVVPHVLLRRGNQANAIRIRHGVVFRKMPTANAEDSVIHEHMPRRGIQYVAMDRGTVGRSIRVACSE